MFCPNCGAALPENARACPTCGVQFAPPLTGPLLTPEAPYAEQPPAHPVQPPPVQPAYPEVPPAQPVQPPPVQPVYPEVPPAQPVQPPPLQPVYPEVPPAQPVQPPYPGQPYATQPIPPQPPYAQQPQYPQQPYVQPGQPVPPGQYAQQPYQPQPGELLPTKKRTGLIVAVVVGAILVAGGAAAAFFLLRPAAPAPGTPSTVAAPAPTLGMLPAYAPMPVNTSFEDTATADGGSATDNPDNTAAEGAVVTFYETVNSGDFTAVEALVTADTRSAIDPGAFEGWSATTFEVTWSKVDGDSADVYGRESQRQFGSADRGVKFTLKKEGGSWLVEGWQPVDEATVNGATPSSGQGSGAGALTVDSARDVVSSLLQARQSGDSGTVRLLTTAKFQTDNGAAWLDGIDNSPYFTKYTIKSVVKKGASYVVTVTEVWNSGTETATYTVIDEAGVILVNAWTSK